MLRLFHIGRIETTITVIRCHKSMDVIAERRCVMVTYRAGRIAVNDITAVYSIIDMYCVISVIITERSERRIATHIGTVTNITQRAGTIT